LPWDPSLLGYNPENLWKTKIQRLEMEAFVVKVSQHEKEVWIVFSRVKTLLEQENFWTGLILSIGN